MQIIHFFVDFILHLDKHLVEIVSNYGFLTYAILFLIVFAETGLVVTPFLPGDSLLFATGAIAAIGDLNIFFVLAILIAAAIIGDTVNYWIGHFLGQKIIDSPKVPFINQKHIDKTQAFYAKHGGKTIILARFVPIVRTFAPFVAGVGKMDYSKFILYNIIGGVVWVLSFTLAGYFFGNIPAVKENFTIVVFAIIGISVVPMIFEFVKAKMEHKKNPELRID
ncbi:DedA family protein [Patescibacteria group bacterium]|nr:DedA family protein [Patescibacteria group bacterium]